jgi:hypothetical protein
MVRFGPEWAGILASVLANPEAGLGRPSEPAAGGGDDSSGAHGCRCRSYRGHTYWPPSGTKCLSAANRYHRFVGQIEQREYLYGREPVPTTFFLQGAGGKGARSTRIAGGRF